MPCAVCHHVFGAPGGLGRSVVAVVGRDANALDELVRYLWRRGALTRSSTELEHVAALSVRGGALVLYADEFEPSEVVKALKGCMLELAAAVLITSRAEHFRDLEQDAEGGISLVILPTGAHVSMI